MLAPLLALLIATPPANDWAATGADCSAYVAVDLDLDGLADVACINAHAQCWISLSVHGWKPTGWAMAVDGLTPGHPIGLAAGDLDPDSPGHELAVFYPDHALLLGAFSQNRLAIIARIDAPVALVPGAWGAGVRDDSGAWWSIRDRAFARVDAPAPEDPVQPPPFEPDARPLGVFRGDVTGDGVADRLGVFFCSTPHHHNILRLETGSNTTSGDRDHDGLSDDDEARLGTDPDDRDSDDDGLLDGWEVHGLPRGSRGPDTPLNPLRQDVICAIAIYEGLDEALVRTELERAKRLYAQINTTNPDGSAGLTLHLRFDPAVPRADQGDWWAVGEKHFPPNDRGLMHWMQIAGYGGGGQAQQTGDMGGSGSNWASFAHELGHQLGLSHEGDSIPVWCPFYPSMMNYAFSYALGGDGEAIRFSDGRLRAVELREEALPERVPLPFDDLKYLQHGPFHFTLQDDGQGGTLIDWNHNARFDDEPVEADINYGGSTNAGIRRTIEPSGGSPRLIRAYDTIHLAILSPSQHEVRLRTYEGDERWSDPRSIPHSATNDDPVLVGTDAAGYVFLRRPQGWFASRFDAASIAPPILVPGLPEIDLSAGVVDGRILLVGRRDSDELSTWWLTTEAGVLGVQPGPALDFRSSVPIDFCTDPTTGRLVFAGSATHAQAGPLCLHVAWYELAEGRLSRVQGAWVGGDRAGVHCTTRPVVRCTTEGELTIFHTGWPQDDGQMTAWRTRRIGNQALRDGWLVSIMYDVWTRTRRAVAFEMDPQRRPGERRTAIYAYRWDAAEAHGMRVNDVQVAHNGLGIDPEPMRDHDDGAKISRWGIRHSILSMRKD